MSLGENSLVAAYQGKGQLKSRPSGTGVGTVPLAFETLGPVNQDGFAIINLFGHRLAQISGNNRETTFLFQRLSIVWLFSASMQSLSATPLFPSNHPRRTQST